MFANFLFIVWILIWGSLVTCLNYSHQRSFELAPVAPVGANKLGLLQTPRRIPVLLQLLPGPLPHCRLRLQRRTPELLAVPSIAHVIPARYPHAALDLASKLKENQKNKKATNPQVCSGNETQ